MNENDLTQGQDSFLDIVANLVGILIILVVVVGAHARSAWTARPIDPEMLKHVDSLRMELDQTALEAVSRQRDHQELEREIAQQTAAIARLDQRRHQMLVQIDLVRQQWEAALADQSERDQQLARTRAELNRLQDRFVRLQRQRVAVDQHVEPRVETIEHYPTPIAKTVFSDEVHFLLAGGRLVHVPMEPLIGLMKTQWKVAAQRLVDADDTYAMVGPIEGFRLRYHLVLREVTLRTEAGTIERHVPEFDYFELIPARQSLGVPTEQALRDQSEFARRLDRLDPSRTTISIWVYPDSYQDLARLKSYLRQREFQIASWPLQFGKYISGGPNGFRASAQ